MESVIAWYWQCLWSIDVDLVTDHLESRSFGNDHMESRIFALVMLSVTGGSGSINERAWVCIWRVWPWP